MVNGMNENPISSRWGLDRRALLGLGGVLAVLAWFYFSLPVQIFFGDDGRLIYTAQHGGFLSRFPDSIFQAELLKYRPIASGVLSLLAPMFGTNHAAWEAVGKLVNLAAACVFFLCCWIVTKRNLFVALTLTLLFGISRFAYHGLTQAWGIFEGVPLLLTLLLLLEVILYFEDGEIGSLERAVLWYGLMLYSYERFLPMIVPLLVFLWLARRSMFLIYVSLGIVASNALIKAVFFHFNFLQGTGGQALQFQPADMLHFIAVGTMNLLGFALTPQYLSGMEYGQLHGLDKIPPIIFALSILAVFIGALAFKRPDAPGSVREWGTLIVLLVALALLLVTASVTFRQEYRFLYSPYAVLLILLAYTLGRVQSQRVAVFAATALIGICGVLIDWPYRDYIVNTWFGSTSQWLWEAKMLLIDREAEHSKHVVVITHGVDTVQTFALNPWFFATYDPYKAFDIAFIPEPPSSAPGAQKFRADASYYDVSILHFVDATADVRIHDLLTGRTPRVDLLAMNCNNNRAVTREGWPSLFDSVPSLTMPVGAECRIGPIHIQRGDRLTFFAAVPQSNVEIQGTHVADAATVSVDVTAGKLSETVLPNATALAPLQAHIQWQAYSVDLSRFAGANVTVRFAEVPPAGDAYPGSIAIGMPRIER